MRVAIIHSLPATGGGALTSFNATVDILKRNGVDILPITRNMSELKTSIFKLVGTFLFNTFLTPATKAQANEIISLRPDVVNAFNVYPMFSPWLLKVCHEAGIPVVMNFFNYQFTCPICLHLYKGRVCDRCKYGREYWCVIKNCRDNLPQSMAYALRNFMVRKLGVYTKNVTLFVAPNPFVKRWFVSAGFKADHIEVVPHLISLPELPPSDPSQGEYIAFAGRFSPEKGIETLLAASQIEPQLPVRLAGDWSAMPELLNQAPINVKFVGPLNQSQIAEFYHHARFVVLPTRCFELCPLTLLEAMIYGVPVIASRIGGLPEIIDDGVNGLLFEPGNSRDLAQKMNQLWNNPELGRKMGMAARAKAIREYTEEVTYHRLMEVYHKAITLNNKEHKGLK